MGFFKRLFSSPEPAAAAEPTPAPDPIPSSDVLEDLRGLVSRLSEGRVAAADVDPTARLFDSGYVDSLTSAVLLEHLEKRFGVYVTEVHLIGRLSTLEALAAEVQAKRQPVS